MRTLRAPMCAGVYTRRRSSVWRARLRSVVNHLRLAAQEIAEAWQHPLRYRCRGWHVTTIVLGLWIAILLLRHGFLKW